MEKDGVQKCLDQKPPPAVPQWKRLYIISLALQLQQCGVEGVIAYRTPHECTSQAAKGQTKCGMKCVMALSSLY
jgi:hypothetical protein